MNMIESKAVATLASVVLLVAACGGEGALEPRFVAVHNAMTAMGLAQTGPISEGSLAEGTTATVERALEAGECYTFVAFGSGGARDVDVSVLSESGEEVARDSSHDRQAATQLCPERAGAYQVVVRMTAGDGGYALTSWSGGSSGTSAVAGRTGRVGSGGGAGTCENPIELTLGRPVHGATTEGTHHMQGTCAGGESPEQVYRVTVEHRAQLSAVLSSTYDGSLYIVRTCGSMQSELVCNDDAPDPTRSQVDVTVEAGEYFLVVDGYGTEAGEYDLVVQVADLQSISAICGDAPALAPGQPMSSTTSGLPDYFQATCAGGARSSDRIYSLDVPSRSRLRVRQQTDHDGVVHVRRGCDDPTSEIACNDDFRDQNHSLVTAVVDAGRYYVVSDGYASGQAGNFTLTAELTSEAGGGADGESCQAPGTLTPGQLVDIDTFEARDDMAGSCGGQGSGDVVYELTLRARSRVRATVGESELTGAIYLQHTCGDATTELGCTVVQQNTPASVEATLEPGSYFVVVDGDRPDSFGAAKLDVRIDDLVALGRTCQRAPLIRPGRAISGSTVPESDTFQASCAGGAQSNDSVYRLQLRRRQIVRLELESDYDGVVHLRRDCTDGTTEIACNDDQNDNRHSFIETTLDAGMYYVVVDGFGTGNAGTFTLNVQTSNP